MDVVLFQDSPEAIMPDMIERVLEVDEIVKEFLLERVHSDVPSAFRPRASS